MATYMQKPQEVVRKWYVIDAADRPLGRTAAKAAHILKGKHKPTFTPHIDGGDHVIVINCEKAILTGKKLMQKKYQWHSGWIGGLKEISYDKLMQQKPEKAMMLAVKGMLPKTKLGSKMLYRLRVYRTEEHKNAAQKPEILEF